MDWPSQDIKPGIRVRLKSNPSRIGISTQEIDGSGRRLRILVSFFDGTEEFVLLSALEPIEKQILKPYEIFVEGRFGTSDNLRRSVTYHRLSGKLSNLLYSLNVTNTQFLPYQFKPVINFLDSPSNGILIADEVGLGKTIEAGLIWTELKARIEAKRLLVICPAVLTEKWKFELRERFGVSAEVVNSSELLKKLKFAQKDISEEFALIGSIQGLRPPKGYENVEDSRSSAKLARLMKSCVEDIPLLDMVIIDEAHYLRNDGTQTHELGRLIRAITDSLVMLSATPIQLHSKDLFNLLNILDEGSFPFSSSFDEVLRSNKPLVKLRNLVLSGKADFSTYTELLGEAKNYQVFKKNKQIKHLLSRSPSNKEFKSSEYKTQLAHELEKLNPLSSVLTRTLKRDVQVNRAKRYPVAMRVEMNSVEKVFYEQVTEAVRDYCVTRQLSTGFILTIPQRQMSSCMAAACQRWNNIVEPYNELAADGGEVLDYNIPDESHATNDANPSELISHLIDISQEVGRFPALAKNDSKFLKLYESLSEYWNENPDGKVVLFAFYKDTLMYIHGRLERLGLKSILLYGGMDKFEAIKRFEHDPEVKILLSSEVASEGVDLQFSSLIINYDLPWNPMRIEQRIGRVDRIGQVKERILIWNFFYSDTIDERIYDRLLARLNVFEGTLGELELILGSETSRITRELFTHKLTKEEEESKIELARIAIENNKKDQEMLEKEASHLIAHGDFIQNKVRADNEMGRYISGDDLYSYVKDYLVAEYDGTRFLSIDDEDNKYHCELSVTAKVELSNFIKSQRSAGKTRILASTPPPLFFDNQYMQESPYFERVTQEHPIVRFVTSRLKNHDSQNRPYAVNAVQVSSIHLPNLNKGLYVFSIHICSVSGALDVEKMEYALADIGSKDVFSSDYSEEVVNRAAMKGDDWLSAKNEINLDVAAETFEICREKAEYRLSLYQGKMQRQNDDRINLQMQSIEMRRHIERKRIEKAIEKLSESRDEKKLKMIPLNKARLDKTEESFDRRVEEIRLKEEVQPRVLFVSGGIIKVF